MSSSFAPDVREASSATALPIVVGAHPDAEVAHRPLAYRLQRAMAERTRHESPVVVCDLWYLNDQPLRIRPTVALGGPEVNAATAFLGRHLPTALLVEDMYRIQLDPEGLEPHVCLWGTSPAATSQAVEIFLERYLETFLRPHDGL